jgi:hypothetical protein
MHLIDYLALYRPDLILPLAVSVPALFLLFFLAFSIRKIKSYLEKATQQTNKKRNTLRAYLLVSSVTFLSVLVVSFFLIVLPWYTALFLSMLTAFLYIGSYLLFSKRLFDFVIKKAKYSKPIGYVKKISDSFKVFYKPHTEIAAKWINEHMHILAPSGSGKTKSQLGPLSQQAMDKGLGLLEVEPKGDNEYIMAHIAYLQDQGRFPDDFLFWDPVKPAISNTYNPFYMGMKTGNMQHMASLIIATMPKAGGSATFYEKVQSEFTRAMARLLSILPKTGKMANFIDLYAILAYLIGRRDDKGRYISGSIDYLLETYSQELSGKDKDELSRLWLKSIIQDVASNPQYKNYLRGLQQHLSLYAFGFSDPNLLNSYTPDIVISDAFQEGKVIYFSLRALNFPSGESLDVGKMVLMDLQAYAAYKYANNIVKNMPDIVVIDEAPQVLPPEFQQVFEMARGAGIGVVVAHQSIDQFERIQKGMFDNIFNNCRVKLLLGAGDDKTAKYYSEFLGQELKKFKTKGQSGENPVFSPVSWLFPHWTELTTEKYDYVVRPEEIKAMKVGEGLLAVRGTPLWGVKGKAFFFARNMKGRLEDYIPVKERGNEWDSEEGLRLLRRFTEEFGEVEGAVTINDSPEERERKLKQVEQEIEQSVINPFEEPANDSYLEEQAVADVVSSSFDEINPVN